MNPLLAEIADSPNCPDIAFVGRMTRNQIPLGFRAVSNTRKWRLFERKAAALEQSRTTTLWFEELGRVRRGGR